jgi:hypothetical protein
LWKNCSPTITTALLIVDCGELIYDTIDVLQFSLQICIQKEKREIDLMSCLRIEVTLLKDLQMKTILVKEHS